MNGRKLESWFEVGRTKNCLLLVARLFLVPAWRFRLPNFKEKISRGTPSLRRPETNYCKKWKHIPRVPIFSVSSPKLTLIWVANRRQFKRQNVPPKCCQSLRTHGT